ncbi:MAG: hypothetical protein NUV96_00425 [Candidatus Colwellbacteria bacterium]|nr:hypothetical protein [Candidatus Colwellbacteria bacterium]
MNLSKRVKIVVFVPESHADVVREAIGKAGAGRVGKYDYCSFTSKGFGRFRPQEGAHPAIGDVGKFEVVPEERIEVVCDRENLQDILGAIKKVHPYEETASDVYPLEET